MVAVTLIIVGELRARRIGGQQVQEKKLAVGVGGQCLELAFARAVFDIEDCERQGLAIDTTVLDRLSSAGMRQEVGLDRLLATDQALTDQILLEFQSFARESLRNTANTAVVQRRQAAEMQFAVFQVTLAQALVLNGQQKARLGAMPSLRSKLGASNGSE